MRYKGKITSWNDGKGFGFITSADGGTKVFVHIKAFSIRSRRPDVHDAVTYTVAKDDQGRTHAANVARVGDELSKKSNRASGPPAVLIASLFFTIVGVSVFVTNLPLPVLGAYALISLVTFVAYTIDKSAAQAGRWRTSEGTLHLLALMGGWPGALVAQQTLRHKSKKASFRTVFWITAGLNCAGFAWLHKPDGRTFLEQVLRTIREYSIT